ncbi:MAG TPA: hypothetical protein DF383_07950, partial [Deltaproteobacteria bacterium]|nr:hypothetical protein [Deltaproteobacteria bacterium]
DIFLDPGSEPRLWKLIEKLMTLQDVPVNLFVPVQTHSSASADKPLFIVHYRNNDRAQVLEAIREAGFASSP